MGGVTATLPLLPYVQDGFRIATTSTPDLVEGDCVKLHASEVDAITRTTSDADRFLGVVGSEYGGSAAVSTSQPAGIDARPYVILSGRNVKTKIQDSATVAYGVGLALSSTTAGALVTATAGQPIVGICKEPITSGAVGQTTRCDIFPTGGGVPFAASLVYAVTGVFVDHTTAGSHFVPVPAQGTIVSIHAVTEAATIGNSSYTFEINGVAVTAPALSFTGPNSAGDVETTTPTAANVVAAGDNIEIINDGGATGGGRVVFVFRIGA